ncbi:MAG: LysR family transcriptional regulator [Comamonadaceae bacterium]|nr:LysR family transcriptional regulator [Comamonadaceae bacterium]
MDFRQLEYFQRVAELGSFTKAAQSLGVAQSVVSRHVRQLEVDLRQNLLMRSGQGAIPTAAGNVLLEHARGIAHQVQRAKQDLSRVRSPNSGRVAVGMTPSAARAMAVQLTHKFRQRLPDATLSISEALSLILKEWLLAGRLDLAVIYNPPASSDLQFSTLTSEPLYLIGRKTESPPGLTIPLRMLANTPLIVPNRPHTVRMLVETELILAGYRPNIRMEIDGITAILDLVAEGAGYAILTEHAILTSGQPQRFYLRRIIQPDLYSRLYAATTRERYINPVQKITLELIKSTVGETYPRSMVTI